jgi:beta-lactamase regulating signal transducer with metallopeptidase domain
MSAELSPAWLSSLGLGVVLAWAALPLLGALARRSQGASPAIYHRALLFALSAALSLALAPVLKLLVGPLGGGALRPVASAVAESARVLDWAGPLLESPRRAGASAAVGLAFASVGGLWLGVAGFGLVRLVRASAALRRRLLAAALAPVAVQERAVQLARQRRVRAPEVRISPEFISPFAAGVLSPRIGLDDVVCAGRGAELDFALDHELLHIARRDTLVALWVELARRCFVGHPSARWFVSELAWSREAAVDAVVAGQDPRGYALFLVASAERSSLARAACAGSVFMAHTALNRRIDMLTKPTQNSTRPAQRLALFASSALALGLVASLAPSSWGAPVEGRLSAQGGSGRLPPEQIQAVVRQSSEAFQRCYTDVVPAPRPDTGVDLHFVIGPAGRVSSGHVDSQPFVELGECAERVMTKLVFPAPSGGSVSVSYPLQFSDGKGGGAPPAPGAANPSTDPAPGRLPPDVVRNVVRSHFARFSECYETIPKPRPWIETKLHFTIDTAGKVSEGHVDAESSPVLGACLDRVMRGIVFPAPQGGVVTVGFPITFGP